MKRDDIDHHFEEVDDDEDDENFSPKLETIAKFDQNYENKGNVAILPTNSEYIGKGGVQFMNTMTRMQESP
jgi:hypothetical protein